MIEIYVYICSKCVMYVVFILQKYYIIYVIVAFPKIWGLNE